MPLSQRNSSQPLYAQIEKALLLRIRSEYRAGQLLPTQRELAEEFGTSLITVKRALGELSRKGLLESTRGRGTVVVRTPIRDDRGGVASWTDSMTGLGRQPQTAWCRIRSRVPPLEIARALRLKARERTVRVERLRFLDGDPICLMVNELPAHLVPDLLRTGLTDESLYTWLERRHGLSPVSADEQVEARRPTSKEIQELGKDTRIVLVVRRHTWLAGGRPLEYAQIVAPAHRYRYRVEISKRESQ